MKTLFLLFAVLGVAYGDCTFNETIQSIRPGAQWALRGNTYEGLEWLDTQQAKPTRAEITTAYAACNQALLAREDAKRKARYTVKLSTATPTQQVNAVILLLDLDR